jgi:zinc/manganese transport system ATP-binding protein
MGFLLLGHAMSELVRLENLTISYERHPAVHHVSGIFGRGTLTAITGPNGAGKSTLLKAIAGLITPTEGRIKFSGITRKDISYLPQSYEIERSFPLTVKQFVTMGIWHRSGFFGGIDERERAEVDQTLEELGLKDFGDRHIGNLSSGQFQRVMFARLVMEDANLVLLDEPFSAMDENTTARLLRKMKDWQAEGKTIICVVHDIEQIISRFPDCLLIARELIAWCDTENALTADNQMRARQFTESWGSDEEFCAI